VKYNHYILNIYFSKEGKIIVENISPKTTAGGRKVVDDVKR